MKIMKKSKNIKNFSKFDPLKDHLKEKRSNFCLKIALLQLFSFSIIFIGLFIYWFKKKGQNKGYYKFNYQTKRMRRKIMKFKLVLTENIKNNIKKCCNFVW